jgi:uncharacterized protein YdaL
MRWTTPLCLLLLFFSGCALRLNAQELPCIQIFYDQTPKEEANHYFGRIHTLFIQNLLGHFPRWQQIVSPIQNYSEGQLEQCEANIYLGTYFRAEVPKPFLTDFIKTRHQVMWLGYHLWDFPEEILSQTFGVSFKGLSRLDHDSTKPESRPNYFKYFHYKGEVFEKYGEFDPKDPKKFNSAFELTVLERVEGKGPESQVVAWAEHSSTREKIPYVIVNKNKMYVAESPFSFATEKDRYLIFTDLLFDLLQEKPIYSQIRPAFVRFEDIHPNLPLWQLDAYTRIFETVGVPFGISLIPIFADPLMVQVDDRAERFVTIAQKNYFRGFLSRAEDRRASIIFHGVTHQYKNIKNPFNGLSGDDFEFWDGVNLKPIPEDTPTFVLNRLNSGWELLTAVGITPVAWLTPHYQASPLDFILFGQVFRWNIGRVVYFPHQNKQEGRLPDELTFDVGEISKHQSRLDVLGKTEVNFPRELKPSGQFFPYEIWGDVYGQRLIPENLGNVQPFLNEQVHKTQNIGEMLESAKRNRVLRDHWASLFIHPVLILPSWEEGLGEYPGDGRPVIELLDGIRALGYEFIDLKEWVKTNPRAIRPAPKDLVDEVF